MAPDRRRGHAERSRWRRNDPSSPDNPIVSYLGVLLGMLPLGWGLLAVRPRLTLGSADALRTAPLPSLGIGLAALIGQFVLIALLALCAALLAIIAGAARRRLRGGRRSSSCC